MRNGIWKYFYRNEKIKFEGKYVDGMEEGIHNHYFPTGQQKQSGRYKFGEKEGDWVEWNEDGTLKMTVTYQRGVVLKVDGNKAPVLETSKEEK
jgi:antitoxin component YwqK of YwqJK toxin-antitoxin module